MAVWCVFWYFRTSGNVFLHLLAPMQLPRVGDNLWDRPIQAEGPDFACDRLLVLPFIGDKKFTFVR
jgi:hypothetical protein